MSKKVAIIVLIAQKPLQIQEKLFYEKITEIWQRIHATTKISVLFLNFMSNIVFCRKYERSQFVVLTKLAKSAQIAKIRSLLFTKLFGSRNGSDLISEIQSNFEVFNTDWLDPDRSRSILLYSGMAFLRLRLIQHTKS